MHAFRIFPVGSNILTSVKKSWCIIFVGNLCFWDRINIKNVCEPSTSKPCTRNLGTKTHFIYPQTPLTYRIHVSKPQNIQEREHHNKKPSFLNNEQLNNEQPPKICGCPSINKSTERNPHVLHYPHPHCFHHCSLHYYLSPQPALGMHRKLRSTSKSAVCTFFCPEHRQPRLTVCDT